MFIKDLIEISEKILVVFGSDPATTKILVKLIIGLSIIGLSIIGLFKGIKFLYSLYLKYHNIFYELEPYFSRTDVIRYTKYYIPPKWKSTSCLKNHKILTKEKSLISYFMNHVFPIKKEKNKFYLILAESGIGKTAFMINLYIQYKKLFSFFNTDQHEIKLFPLGYHNILNTIQEIQNKNKTILLLDAFDEDVNAIKNYKERLHELLGVIDKFYITIISCRLQFFESNEDEPLKTKVFSGGDSGEYIFQKIYLSNFDDKYVKKYINKKFDFYAFKSKNKAYRIINKSPSLMAKPMLLSYIDDLIDEKQEYKYTFQIYDKLINLWIERESKKRNIDNEEEYRNALFEFSRKLALFLYETKTESNDYCIKIENFLKLNQSITSVLQTTKMRSMLIRDFAGNYKFSHQSILEYFLALELFNNPDYLNKFDFNSMSSSKLFFYEMAKDKLLQMSLSFNQTTRDNIASDYSNYILINKNFDTTQIHLLSAFPQHKIILHLDDDLLILYNCFLIAFLQDKKTWLSSIVYQVENDFSRLLYYDYIEYPKFSRKDISNNMPLVKYLMSSQLQNLDIILKYIPKVEDFFIEYFEYIGLSGLAYLFNKECNTAIFSKRFMRQKYKFELRKTHTPYLELIHFYEKYIFNKQIDEWFLFDSKSLRKLDKISCIILKKKKLKNIIALNEVNTLIESLLTHNSKFQNFPIAF